MRSFSSAKLWLGNSRGPHEPGGLDRGCSAPDAPQQHPALKGVEVGPDGHRRNAQFVRESGDLNHPVALQQFKDSLMPRRQMRQGLGI